MRPLAVDEELALHRTNLCIYDDPHIHLIRQLRCHIGDPVLLRYLTREGKKHAEVCYLGV